MLLYNVLLVFALPGILLRLLWRARKNPGYALRIAERFGFYQKTFQTGGIVIHAVSVGETVAAGPLIQLLQAHYPNTPLTITSTTPTGSARVKNLFGDTVQHVYLPYDYPGALKRFFSAFKPSQLIIMETEWWPNLFIQTHKRGIPLFIANARLSERSLKGYSRIASLTRRMARCITLLGAQTSGDLQRFLALGIPSNRVLQTGNIKFDLTVNSLDEERSARLRATFKGRPVWIAASTHAGEEALVIETVKAVLAEHPETLAIVVPRHPERFAPFHQLLSQAGLSLARRSQNENVETSTQVYFGDTMGELMLLYGASPIAFVGGSFVAAGGHNMLEAAIMGCAIVMGPHLENLTEQAARLVDAQGMKVVHSPAELAHQISEWLNNPSSRQACAEHALSFMQANRGAAQRTFQLLEGVKQ
jgi:3-deoxy-D-manno-octulosonic-acid transferase